VILKTLEKSSDRVFFLWFDFKAFADAITFVFFYFAQCDHKDRLFALTWVKHAATRAAISLGTCAAGQSTANGTGLIADRLRQRWLLQCPAIHPGYLTYKQLSMYCRAVGDAPPCMAPCDRPFEAAKPRKQNRFHPVLNNRFESFTLKLT
jgi:hypothetical protein